MTPRTRQLASLRLRRYALVLPLVVLCAWLAVTMGRWAMADLQLSWARAQMDDWTPGAGPPSLEAWRSVADVLTKARGHRPNNPYLYEQLGRLHGLIAGRSRDSVTLAHLREARAHYETAIRLRPASPYTWSDLAWVLHRLGEYGIAFEVALERATALGPWERPVQLQLLQVGLAAWGRLDGTSRERVLATARRALRQDVKSVVSVAREVGQFGTLCRELGDMHELRIACPGRAE